MKRVYVISLPKELSVRASEEFISKLGSLDAVDLELPVGSSGYSFAGLSSATQAVITWARKFDVKCLSLKSGVNSTEDQIDDLVRKPHKFAAAMLAEKIISKKLGLEYDIRSEIYLKAKSAIESQHVSPDGLRLGRLCWIVFVDHSSLAHDPKFYLTSAEELPQVRRLEQLKNVVARMITQSITVAGGAKLPSEEGLDAIGKMFYELFLNTDEHGRRDKEHRLLKKSIRLLTTYGVNLTDKAVAKAIAKMPVIADFVGQTSAQNRYVEISIVDSGIGYVESWNARSSENTKRDMSIQEEFEIFEKCFKFGQTSSGEIHKGVGLPTVLDRLSKLRALLKIRTGRLSLYWDFASNPVDTENTHFMFYDWETQEKADVTLTANCEAAGVAITMLIPLESKLVLHE